MHIQLILGEDHGNGAAVVIFARGSILNVDFESKHVPLTDLRIRATGSVHPPMVDRRIETRHYQLL
jgi:hypothetical protein